MIDWLIPDTSGIVYLDGLLNWLIDWLIDLYFRDSVPAFGWTKDHFNSQEEKFGWLIDWLIGWLIDWLIDTSGIVCLPLDGLRTILTPRRRNLVDWLIVDWLINWLINWLIDWYFRDSVPAFGWNEDPFNSPIEKFGWLIGWLVE